MEATLDPYKKIIYVSKGTNRWAYKYSLGSNMFVVSKNKLIHFFAEFYAKTKYYGNDHIGY